MKRITTYILLIIILIIIIQLFMFPVWAGSQVSAVVTYLSGKVESAHGIQVKLGDRFKTGDRIKTGPRATLELKLEDGSMVKLGEKTTVEVADLTRDTSGKKSYVFKIIIGKVRALVTQFTVNRDRFELQGPTAMAGISGSDLGAEVTPEDEYYYGFDGKLYSKIAGGKPDPLHAYYVVRYKAGKKISGPLPMSAEDYRDWDDMTFQTPGVRRPSITSEAGVDEKETVMQVIRDLVDRYERRRITAFMRLWNDERFRGYNQLEVDIERDFENYRDLRLLYKNARLTLAPGGRAIFEADWEKRYLIPWNLSEEKQAGRMQLLLEKEKGKWMISGMSGARIFGSTAAGLPFPDLAITGLDVVTTGSIPSSSISTRASQQASVFPPTSVTVFLSVRITATIKNLTGHRADNVVIRFFEGNNQIGNDQRVSVSGSGTAQASISWIPGLPIGKKVIKVVIDPDERIPDINRSNNTGQKEVEVKAGDAVLTVSPTTVTFPTGTGDTSITIRVVDIDRDNENSVNVVLRATYTGMTDVGACISVTDTETFDLTKTTTGTFQRTTIPTFKGTGIPTSNNGRFQFSSGCVSSIEITVSYTEPITSTGQRNVERTATFTAN